MPFNIGPKIHNVIPKELKTLIKDFFYLKGWKGLYLTGGTCLAEYYFGHRLSVDMDLFTQEKELFEEAKAYFSDPSQFKQGTLVEKRITPYLCQYLYVSPKEKEPIKIDLVHDTVEHLSPPLQIGSVWIDSLPDLLANKIGCLISRSEVKDFLDLFYLIPASQLKMNEIVDLALKKEGGLDPLIMANQIEFIFRQKQPHTQVLGKTDWKELQLFFKKIQKECLDLIRP